MTQTELFTNEYFGKVFYFCLKKTGNQHEAEELAGDIALNVVDSLAKYPPPTHFSAWVWTIAQRRYARWAGYRSEYREHIILSDNESDTPEPASDESVENSIIEKEQYSLLRRELAFISNEYRELLVAYYINDIRISELSRRLGLPTGTIKTRLMRARKILKEGMDMAREFGKRSYNPEDVNFCASGNQPDGLPWSAVNRKIPNNILLEASNNPSTAEELSMELGIALPYMEDEINRLVDATLLEKIGDKYVTNFFIADKETQVEIYKTMRRDSIERSKLLAEAINDNYAEIRELIAPTCSEDDFKWFVYIYAIDRLIAKIDGYGIWNIFKRPNGGNWGFCGYERHDLIPENVYVNHNMCGTDTNACMGQYSVKKYGFPAYSYDASFNTEAANLLADIVMHDRGEDSITEAESQTFKGLCKKFAHIENGKIIPDIVVLRPNVASKLIELVLSHPSGKRCLDMLNELFAEIREILKRNSNEVLHKTLNYYVSMFIFDARGMLMNDNVDSGVLKVPENPANSNAGTYLSICD
ncbi:MAG: RNA polymerase sigma factor [Clostridiales bacterium]|nr:RNA polymerase sigma factor [Clostridiales bacterium]